MGEAKLAAQILAMKIDSGHGEKQDFSDLLAGAPLSDEMCNLNLLRSQSSLKG